MRQRDSIAKCLASLGLLAQLFMAGQAWSATTDLGTLAGPVSLNYSNTFLAPQNQFYDDYLFAISPSSVSSITSTINLGNIFGINNLQARLYSGTITTSGKPSGLLEAWSTAITVSGPGYTGTTILITPITLVAGNYILEIRGDVVGTAGGTYAGVLAITPVPEAAEWAMLLTGMAFMGFVAARRSRNNIAGEMSGMYGVYHDGAKVMDSFIHALSWEDVLNRITSWARARESRYVCLCNVHSVVTADRNKEFNQVLRHADLALPDGMPVAWMLRKLGFSRQQRINGPDLMWKYCEQAAHKGDAVYFYGSTLETLRLMSAKLQAAFPALQIAGVYSPPFRTENMAEDDEIIQNMNESGAGVVFVGLGCPKQEKWMAMHQDRIHAVMVGVGAAFDYHAGTTKRAPLWMQRNGLEWAHRLFSDPRRLWKRYLVTNTLFIFGACWQLFRHELRNIKLRRFASRQSVPNLGQRKLKSA